MLLEVLVVIVGGGGKFNIKLTNFRQGDQSVKLMSSLDQIQCVIETY